MDTNTQIAPTSSQTRKSPFFTIIGVIILVATITAGVYFFLQKESFKKDNQSIQTSITKLNQELEKIDTQKIEATLKAQEIIKIIEENEIQWSQVISRIQDLIPLDNNGQAKILFSSYSGSSDGIINMSATSRPDRGSESAKVAFGDISELIKVFNESQIFQNSFVPSIAKGLTDEGNTVLSFNFSALYSPQKQKRK